MKNRNKARRRRQSPMMQGLVDSLGNVWIEEVDRIIDRNISRKGLDTGQLAAINIIHRVTTELLALACEYKAQMVFDEVDLNVSGAAENAVQRFHVPYEFIAASLHDLNLTTGAA